MLIEKDVKIKYNLGATINIGNYESIRVDVGMEMPCIEKDIDKTFKKVKDDVVKLIKGEIKHIRGIGGL